MKAISYALVLTILMLLGVVAMLLVIIADKDSNYWWVSTDKRAALFRAIWLLILMIIQGILMKL